MFNGSGMNCRDLPRLLREWGGMGSSRHPPRFFIT